MGTQARNIAQILNTDSTITTADIADDAVTGAKIENNPTVAGNLATGGTLAIAGHGTIGNAGTIDAARALTVVGATDGTSSSIIVGYNSSLASKFSVRDDGYMVVGNGITLSDGNLAVADGHGIDFSADANNAGMTSELLDDYEQGTFTPTLVSTGSTFQYSVRQGIYTKVGDLVTFNIVVQLDGGGNSFSSNSVALNGWPFTSRNSQGANARFYIHGRYLNVDTSGGYYYAFADLNGNSGSAPLKEGGDNIPIASLGANRLSSSSGQLYLHGHYYTDA
tara:strand:+ start:143 stop:979 length:837 start_codon:yes stop_codon:yes gene_type:complete